MRTDNNYYRLRNINPQVTKRKAKAKRHDKNPA